MQVFRIFTTPAGDSEIEIRQVPMSQADRPMSDIFNSESIFFRETPQGHVQDFHNAPRRQLIFITSGVLELETSQGKRVICQPGDVLFTEDAQGRGHITRSLRGTRGFFHVVVPESFDVSAWPLLTS